MKKLLAGQLISHQSLIIPPIALKAVPRKNNRPNRGCFQRDIFLIKWEY